MKRFRLDARCLVAMVIGFGPMAAPASSQMMMAHPSVSLSIMQIPTRLLPSSHVSLAQKLSTEFARVRNSLMVAHVLPKAPPADSALLSA